jgi:ABC-type Fe2+-enterobactin transport system substrate-binding protein
MPESEVARLLQQISLERQAALNGLKGLASGTARHDFINAKEQHIATLHEKLTAIVGKNEATRLVIDVYSKQDVLNSREV